MAAQQLKPFLYRYYNGVIYKCRRVTHGNSFAAIYRVTDLPPGITIQEFAPGLVRTGGTYNSLEFLVETKYLKTCTMFYPSKTACKNGAGRVLAEMLKDPNADKEAIHEQINKLKRIKT